MMIFYSSDLFNRHIEMKPKVFVTRFRESFPSEVMSRLEEFCEVSYWKDDSVIPKPQLIGRDWILLCFINS